MGTTNSQDADLKTDVQIIREILFGDQSKNFQQRIESLDVEISSLKEEIRQLRKALADAQKKRQRDDEASEERHKLMIAELTKQLERTDQSQKKVLDELRSSLESRFQKHETDHTSTLKQHNEFLSSLMALLDSYKQQTSSD